MGRARRARKIASAAAYGGGLGAAGLAGVGLTAWAVLRGEAAVARRVVGQPFEGAPDDNGRYGAAPGDPIQMVVIGDSTAKGMGTEDRYQTMGAIIATATAAILGQPVDLHNHAVIGAISTDLGDQVTEALEECPSPDVALIVIGANDVTKSVQRTTSVRHLAAAVAQLRDAGAQVVVGTCPDLGVVEPVPQPLRLLVRRWSRDLAAAQTVAVVEQGGRTVSLGDLLREEFRTSPQIMFSKDRFHPSAAGYARAAAALLPSVLDALGDTSLRAVPIPLAGAAGAARRRPAGVGPVAVAATQAVREPGSEVSGTDVGGQERGSQGRWARLLRRQRGQTNTAQSQPTPADVAEGKTAEEGTAEDQRAQDGTATDQNPPEDRAAIASSESSPPTAG